MSDDLSFDPGILVPLPDDPPHHPWVALTSADLRGLADELDRLTYTTSAVAGQTRCGHGDSRVIEFRRQPGQTDLVALVVGHEPPPAQRPQENP